MFKVLSMLFVLISLMIFYVGFTSSSMVITVFYIINGGMFLFIGKEFWDLS